MAEVKRRIELLKQGTASPQSQCLAQLTQERGRNHSPKSGLLHAQIVSPVAPHFFWGAVVKRVSRVFFEDRDERGPPNQLGGVDIHKMSIIKAASQTKPAKFLAVFS